MSLKIYVDCSTSSTGATTRPDPLLLRLVNILEFKFVIIFVELILIGSSKKISPFVNLDKFIALASQVNI